ncbi:MAG: iron-containing redox enzyme family protein [Pseudomonadota bacterium]
MLTARPTVSPIRRPATVAAVPHTQRHHASARRIYQTLQSDVNAERADARAFLDQQLASARLLPVELPDQLDDLTRWVHERSEAVGLAYRAYLDARQAGAPRRYFSNKSHALYFLQAAAPTKMVDGAWLYGVLARWDDPDFHPLIQTYLEELGDGVAEKNHVVLYKKLLAQHGCDQWQHLDDSHFIQGAIQLGLAGDAEHFLPEIIGFNLGYEQLPLHLLITAYELNELGIDPYYFTLHITVDNAGTGHAQKAVQALQQLMPRCGDVAAFYRRVQDGYRLNDLGASTSSVIAEFDLEAELVRILAAKSVVGKNMHSDYCRVGGRSINDWLAQPDQLGAMLAALESAGWIERGKPAEHSRFWRLIQSERAEMFGVFNSYEQQVLSDWISAAPGGVAAANDAPRTLSFRARQRALDALAQPQPHPRRGSVRQLIRHHPKPDQAPPGEAALALRQLESRVAAQGSKAAAMTLLTSLMSPADHHHAAGLMATRMYCQLWR